MFRLLSAVVVLLEFTPLLVQAAGPEGKTVVDYWDAVFLEGNKAGHVHTTVVEVERNGQKRLIASTAMHLIVKRFNQVTDLKGESGTEELLDGQVVGTFMRQSLGSNKELVIVGIIQGKQLELTLDGKPGSLKPAPWDDRAIGQFQQHGLFAAKKAQPGDKFSYYSFEPTVNLVVRMDVVVKNHEMVELLGKGGKVKLLRIETTPQKLQGVELPKLVAWVNEDWKPLRQDTELPGLGKITMYRTTKEVALAPAVDAGLTDVGIGQLIRLNRKVLNPYDTSNVVYRITIKGETDAAAAFSQNDRQKVMNARGSTFELHVNASKGPKKAKANAKISDEFTQSSYFITSADAKVKQHARQAVGSEKDPWKKALRIEKWVHANMTNNNVVGVMMAPADTVAKTLEGDCTEFAMLMAAMCRAEGVPSKIAIGIVYNDANTGPVMAFHMWTEVWVAGDWVPLDATLGKGYVGATHLKVTDHSWHEIRSLTPVLPLMRVIGKTQVEIIRAN